MRSWRPEARSVFSNVPAIPRPELQVPTAAECDHTQRWDQYLWQGCTVGIRIVVVGPHVLQWTCADCDQPQRVHQLL